MLPDHYASCICDLIFVVNPLPDKGNYNFLYSIFVPDTKKIALLFYGKAFLESFGY